MDTSNPSIPPQTGNEKKDKSQNSNSFELALLGALHLLDERISKSKNDIMMERKSMEVKERHERLMKYAETLDSNTIDSGLKATMANQLQKIVETESHLQKGIRQLLIAILKEARGEDAMNVEEAFSFLFAENEDMIDSNDYQSATVSISSHPSQTIEENVSVTSGNNEDINDTQSSSNANNDTFLSTQNQSTLINEPEYLSYSGTDGMFGIEAINGENVTQQIDSVDFIQKEIEQLDISRKHQESETHESSLKESKTNDVSHESKVLIEKLYSHLLPYGILDQSHSQQNVWKDTAEDEDDGYTVHTLARTHLIELETNFQNLVNAQLEDTEGDLLQKEEHERFEQDLKAAEDLLDKEEKRAKAVAEGVALGGKLEDVGGNTVLASRPHPLKMLSRMLAPKKEKKEDNEEDDETASYEDENEQFTGLQNIRKIGFGKEGELEQFPLPIVYKSFHTGFEPTKDLILEPGTIVADQYLVENELGSAAFSTAYKCIDLSTDPDDYYYEVCLKVIKNTKDFFDQSLDEIKVLELLRQTGECEENNILEMRSFFYYREHLIIVTELLRQNLFEFNKFILDHGEVPYFTMTRLCYLTRQILIALNYIHNLGLIHSDVKPENILIASYSRARVKLIDFGSSCFITDRQSTYIQSRSYRAPEVILGLPYDGKIDIWSLGCVVAEMFTGQVTFQNRSVVSMLSRIEAICGPFPRHLTMNGKHSSKFFTPNGLIYETIDKDEIKNGDGDYGGSIDNHAILDTDEDCFNLYTPKRTTLAERLGFTADLMERPRDTLEEEEKALFTDFVRSLLTIDPESRPTAAEALRHPWIVSGEVLTESDIKYSPEQ